MQYPELELQFIGKRVKVLDGQGNPYNTGYVREIYNDGTCLLFNPQTYTQYFYAELSHCEIIESEE